MPGKSSAKTNNSAKRSPTTRRRWRRCSPKVRRVAQDQSLLQQKQSRASDNKRTNLADKREAAELKKKEHAAEANARAEQANQHVAQFIAYLPFPYDDEAEWILKTVKQP